MLFDFETIAYLLLVGATAGVTFASVRHVLQRWETSRATKARWARLPVRRA